MKAIVLSGGYATRLWPMTQDKPKMLLPLGESLVIDPILHELETVSRVDDVYVSTNTEFAPDFERYLENRPYEKPRISVEESGEEAEKLGVVGALDQLTKREQIADDELLVVAGDNVMDMEIAGFADRMERTDSPLLAAYDIESTEKASSYGLVQTDNGTVTQFQEKPSNPETTLVSIACYGLPAEHVRFDEYLDDGQNPDEPGWYFQWLQGQTELLAHEFTGTWFDIGTPASYLEAVEWRLDGDSIVAESAVVNGNTTVKDNVHILPGAEVYDSTLRRTVVFPDARIRHCEVDSSIIDMNAYVRDARVKNALIGPSTDATQ